MASQRFQHQASCPCHRMQPLVFVPRRSAAHTAGSRSRGPLPFDPLHGPVRRAEAAAAEDSGSMSSSAGTTTNPSGDFCIIESRDAVRDFDQLQLNDITDAIGSRQNRIFLLMEEVRRLRIQQRLKGGEVSLADQLANEQYVSALPFLPPLSQKTLRDYFVFYGCFVATMILFGGILAPMLELKLGLGGTSYQDFVESLHLPQQLAQVDPIVASFCGGSVGVLSALLVVEVNNVKKQQRNRCHYCDGAGYLSCGACVASGRDESGGQCAFCAGTGKVMCTSCLCTGKQMATEHDPRIDPFSA